MLCPVPCTITSTATTVSWAELPSLPSPPLPSAPYPHPRPRSPGVEYHPRPSASLPSRTRLFLQLLDVLHYNLSLRDGRSASSLRRNDPTIRSTQQHHGGDRPRPKGTPRSPRGTQEVSLGHPTPTHGSRQGRGYIRLKRTHLDAT